MTKMNVAVAAATAAATLSAGPAPAQDYAPGSINQVIRSLPLPNGFREDDIGLIVTRIVEACGLPNGPYRRVSNQAAVRSGNFNPPEPSAGDARYDYIVYYANSVPSSGFDARVTVRDVKEQFGIEFGGGPRDTALSAHVSTRSGSNGEKYVTVTGTTPNNTQILDAGPDVGEMEFIAYVKNGTPKTIDAICGINMYYCTDASCSDFEYGVKDFLFSDQTNQLIIGWAGGMSGAGSDANAATLCGILNPPGRTPLRYTDAVNGFQPGDYDPPAGLPASCPADGELDPGDSCVGDEWIREEFTDSTLGNVVRIFGDFDDESPTNVTACGGTFAAYCDPKEPTPALGKKSGNACNRERGLTSVPNFNYTAGQESNTGVLTFTGGAYGYYPYPKPR